MPNKKRKNTSNKQLFLQIMLENGNWYKNLAKVQIFEWLIT